MSHVGIAPAVMSRSINDNLDTPRHISVESTTFGVSSDVRFAPGCQSTAKSSLSVSGSHKSDRGGFARALDLLTITDCCFSIMRALFES
jgi:hypothetical protein